MSGGMKVIPRGVVVSRNKIVASELIKSSSVELSVSDCTGTFINNFDQDSDCLYELPEAAKDLAFEFLAGTTVSKYVRFKAKSSDAIMLDGSKGSDGGSIGITSVAEGNSISFRTYKTDDDSWDWFAISIYGSWVVI